MDIFSSPFLQIEGAALVAFAAALTFSRYGGYRSAFHACVGGFIAALALCQFREIVDLGANAGALSASGLRDECGRDMALNLFGAAAGTLLWASAAASAAALRALFQATRPALSSRLHEAGGPQ